MKRDDLTEKMLDTKRTSGMSWEDIAEKIGGCSPILITAALLGQMKLSPAQANRARELFHLSEAEAKMLTEIPYRGSLPSIPPTDPLVVRSRHLHPLAAHLRANVGIKRTTSNFLFLVELLNLTFERELVAGGTQMSNSLH